MVYKMFLSVDGGCRNNGSTNAISAAACIVHFRYGRDVLLKKPLPNHPRPTSQRAELHAIILALQTAWHKYNNLDRNPRFYVTIYTDLKYASGCMTRWKEKWLGNGFMNAKGWEVANRDLIEMAYGLEEKVAGKGRVRFVWVPREDNGMLIEWSMSSLTRWSGGDDE